MCGDHWTSSRSVGRYYMRIPSPPPPPRRMGYAPGSSRGSSVAISIDMSCRVVKLGGIGILFDSEDGVVSPSSSAGVILLCCSRHDLSPPGGPGRPSRGVVDSAQKAGDQIHASVEVYREEYSVCESTLLWVAHLQWRCDYIKYSCHVWEYGRRILFDRYFSRARSPSQGYMVQPSPECVCFSFFP